MAGRNKINGMRGVAIGLLGLVAVSLPSPASAQGLFERIFGGLRQAVHAPARQPVNIHSFVDPFTSLANAISGPRQLPAENGPTRAFCVRTCDGHYFPVQSRAGLSAAESCNAFCPASQTRLYSGGAIDYAVASNGSRYSDLENAFLYRKQMVAGCTCNGRDAFGLARMDVAADPTLRQGDIVATKTGLVAFTGTKNNVAAFTPIDEYRGLSKNARDKISEIKIMPPTPVAADIPTATISRNVRADDNRRAQLER